MQCAAGSDHEAPAVGRAVVDDARRRVRAIFGARYEQLRRIERIRERQQRLRVVGRAGIRWRRRGWLGLGSSLR
jgi:hypothetical protein